jgi:hypothetical protein
MGHPTADSVPVIEALRRQGDEEAAYLENERRDRAASGAEVTRMREAMEAVEAAAAVTKFLGYPVDPADLTRVERLGWKAAWSFTFEGFDLEVRRNAFHGLRLMDGSRGGDGRVVRIVADLFEPTSHESRSAARDRE